MTLAHDSESHERIVERRNFLIGHWAGRLLGLEGQQLVDYAGEVMAADTLVPGPRDVIAKLQRDLQEQGLPVTRSQVRLELLRAQDRAEMEMAHTARP